MITQIYGCGKKLNMDSGRYSIECGILVLEHARMGRTDATSTHSSRMRREHPYDDEEYLMPKVADIGAKRLISLAPDQWAQWVTQCPDVTVRSIARSEFEWVSRASDVALRAYKPDVGEFLILNEMQFFYKWHMPFRINAYASLAEEKYRLPVFPVMVVLRPPGAGVVIQDYYEQNFLGLSVRRTYQVIKLWEIEAEPVLAQPIPTLLPFVPLLKGGESEPTVRQALGKLRDDPILHEMETLLAFFATFVLESSLVQQIMW